MIKSGQTIRFKGVRIALEFVTLTLLLWERVCYSKVSIVPGVFSFADSCTFVAGIVALLKPLTVEKKAPRPVKTALPASPSIYCCFRIAGFCTGKF